MKITAVVKMGNTKKLKLKSKLTDKEKRELAAPPAQRELALISAGIRIFEAVIRVIFSSALIIFVLFLFSCA